MSDTVHTPMLEPVRRVEIFTGAGRRRTWSAEEKAQIIAESYGEGETVSSVARRHGLTSSQLFWWRRVARQGKAEGEEAIAFASVKVRAAAKTERRDIEAKGVASAPSAMIEIVLGPALVRVHAGADGPTLSAVVGAIRDWLR